MSNLLMSRLVLVPDAFAAKPKGMIVAVCRNLMFDPLRRVEDRNATFGFLTHDGESFAACVFDDGLVLTTHNWQQSEQPLATDEDIEKIDWVEPGTFERAVVLNGVPALFEAW